MTTTSADAPRICAEYPKCRRNAAKFCAYYKCGNCCDRSSPCSPTNHNKHGLQARGTKEPSQKKRQRRTVQAMLQTTVDELLTSEWFSERLQVSGYTKRTFSLMIYDHFELMASAADRSESELSFATTPFELMRIEEELSFAMETTSNVELSKFAGESTRKNSSDANRDIEQDLDNAMTSSPGVMESIRHSFQHIDSHEEREDRIAWRKELFRRLRSPPSMQLLEDGRSVGLTKDSLVRLVDKDSPLAFADALEYHCFVDDLAAAIRKSLWMFQEVIIQTEARRLSGFQIIIYGTATTLYSESPGDKQGRLFDKGGKGESNLNVAIVFEASQCYSTADSQALVSGIIFGKSFRFTNSSNVQFVAAHIQRRFDLNEDFLTEWKTKLGRDIIVTVALTSETHGNKILSFNEYYSFAWKIKTSTKMPYTESAFSKPRHTKTETGPTQRSLQEMIQPEPENRRPMRHAKNAYAPHFVHSHYQRDIPRNFSSNSVKDLQELDRRIATFEITFDNMQKWLQARDVLSCFREVRMQNYEWAHNPRRPDTHRYGVWFKCLLKEEAVFPALSQNKIGVKLDDAGGLLLRTSHESWCDFDKGIHASSMYSVKRILDAGLREGSAKEHNLRGIFCFNMNNSSLAVKSMGHAMYSELFDDNVFWAPYYELQIQRSCAESQKLRQNTSGDNWICTEALSPEFGPMFHLTVVWFHALTMHDLGKQGCNWIALDSFHKGYELS
jgi:hypothetical protein